MWTLYEVGVECFTMHCGQEIAYINFIDGHYLAFLYFEY